MIPLCRENESATRWVCEEVWTLSGAFTVNGDVLQEAQVGTTCCGAGTFLLHRCNGISAFVVSLCCNAMITLYVCELYVNVTARLRPQVRLLFEGVDTLVDVSLNDHDILKARNFHRYKYAA
jgi:hypothetical protein